MEQVSDSSRADDASQPKWQPLRAIDRRVVGVLAEKAKTTPDIYPMSLNAVCTGCNQKSNRSPAMNLEPDDVQESLDRLRELGAVAMVEGYGRVTKYRHYLYKWLGVDKVELAVMTELLLRGPQTEGELRGRAARMEPIADLNALRPVLAALRRRKLVVALTPEGRGHVVTHALYRPEELQRLRAEYVRGSSAPPADSSTGSAAPAGSAAAKGIEEHIVATIRNDIDELKSQLSQLRADLRQLVGANERVEADLQKLKDSLGA